MKKKYELQAFPTDIAQDEGMTLRDYFAAKVIQGLMANSFIAKNSGLATTLDEVNAKSAYAMADAMMKAREI